MEEEEEGENSLFSPSSGSVLRSCLVIKREKRTWKAGKRTMGRRSGKAFPDLSPISSSSTVNPRPCTHFESEARIDTTHSQRNREDVVESVFLRTFRRRRRKRALESDVYSPVPPFSPFFRFEGIPLLPLFPSSAPSLPFKFEVRIRRRKENAVLAEPVLRREREAAAMLHAVGGDTACEASKSRDVAVEAGAQID